MSAVSSFGIDRRNVLLSGKALLCAAAVGSESCSSAQTRHSVNVRAMGARGDGVHDDRNAIQTVIDTLAAAGGGEVIIPVGRFALGTALHPRSNITIRGVDRQRSILQAAPGSIDNVVGIDYLVEGQVAARRRGKRLDRLMAPDFTAMAEDDARRSGGYAGYGVANFHLRDLVIDGNKDHCPENGNFLATTRIDGQFLPGETIRSSSGGVAMVAAVFEAGDPRGVSIRPSTIAGTGRFEIGDEIVGPSGRMLLAHRRGDDAYQVGVVFHAATACSLTGCTVRNTVYQAVVVYNACSQIDLVDNVIQNPNKAGTVYKGGSSHIFCDFDNRKIRISSNRLSGGEGYGIVVTETGGRTDGVIITENTIVGTPGDGIRIASESSKSSATIADIRISNNTINNCGDTAVRLAHNGFENGILNPVISGNRITKSRFGILISGRVQRPLVNGNKLSDIAGVALDLGFGPTDRQD